VQEAKGEAPAPRLEVSVDLPVAAYLPEDYAPDRNQRIDLYRRLAAVPERGKLEEVAGEIADRFGGPLPEAAGNLVRLAGVKIRCAEAGVQRIGMEGNLAMLMLADDRRLTPQMVRKLRQRLPAEIRIWIALLNHDRVVVSLRKANTEQVFSRLEDVLEALASLPLEEEAKRQRRREELASR